MQRNDRLTQLKKTRVIGATHMKVKDVDLLFSSCFRMLSLATTKANPALDYIDALISEIYYLNSWMWDVKCQIIIYILSTE